MIARYFKPANKGEGKFMSSTEIAMYLNSKGQHLKINPNNIGKTMNTVYQIESSLVKINGKATRGYWLWQGFTEAEGENRAAVTGEIWTGNENW